MHESFNTFTLYIREKKKSPLLFLSLGFLTVFKQIRVCTMHLLGFHVYLLCVSWLFCRASIFSAYFDCILTSHEIESIWYKSPLVSSSVALIASCELQRLFRFPHQWWKLCPWTICLVSASALCSGRVELVFYVPYLLSWPVSVTRKGKVGFPNRYIIAYFYGTVKGRISQEP